MIFSFVIFCNRCFTITQVTFYHDCINQLRFSLQTSGPVQGSPNYFPNNNHEYEILLLNQLPTNTTNCISGEYTFIFHDNLNNDTNNLYNQEIQSSSSTKNISFENSRKCCFDANQKVHHYYSLGKLSELIDQTLINNYTLIIEDLKNDYLQGYLVSYNIKLQSISCHMRYQWKQLNYTTNSHNQNNIPPARYNANILTFNSSVFIFGGKDVNNQDLKDLYRYDLITNTWYKLNPTNFYSNPLNAGNSIGSNYVMTPYGLIRYGGYYRQPYLNQFDYCNRMKNKKNEDGDIEVNELCYYNSEHMINSNINTINNYDNNVFLMDPITMRWQLMNMTVVANQFHNLNSNITRNNNFFHYQKNSYQFQIPSERYFSSFVFIPSNSLQWKQNIIQLNSSTLEQLKLGDFDRNERMLYDNYQLSSQFNYQSYMSDSLLLFGGFDSATGSFKDGSSSGYLQDMWFLRLNSFSTKYNRDKQLSYIKKNCQWRNNPSAKNDFHTYNCLTTNNNLQSRNCQLRDLFLLVWCSQYNQTLS
jgi:hypothetical protein